MLDASSSRRPSKHFLPAFYRAAKSGDERARAKIGESAESCGARFSSVMLGNVETGLSRRGSRVRVPSAPPMKSVCYVVWAASPKVA